MKSRKNQPEGFIWQDDEQPKAIYPAIGVIPRPRADPDTCVYCGQGGRAGLCNYCNHKWRIAEKKMDRGIYGF